MILTSPTDAQWYSIANSQARINLWHGSVRSGKSVASIFRWLQHVVTGPPGDLLMVGKTPNTVYRNVIVPYFMPVMGASLKISLGSANPHLVHEPSGRIIYLAGANDMRAEEKIRGMTLAGAYGDEVTVWPTGMLEQLDARCSIAGAKIFLTTNPDGPKHWLKTDYLDREGDLGQDIFRSFHFKLEDNPYLPPAYIDNLRKLHVGLWAKRFIEGLWAVAEGAVFPQWDPELHTYAGVPVEGIYDHYLSADVGYTNPTAALLGLVGPSVTPGMARSDRIQAETSRGLYVAGELRATGLTDAAASTRIRSWLEGLRIDPSALTRTVYDPAAPSFGEQLYQDRFAGVEPANSSDVMERIRIISMLLSSGTLRVHESCEGLAEEFTSYIWDPNAQKRGQDKPQKMNDHSIDALGYLVRATEHRWRPWVRTFDPAIVPRDVVAEVFPLRA